LARGDAVDFIASRPHARVDARAAFGANALCGLQEPRAHLEAESLFGERADGAAIDYVEKVVGVVVVAVYRDFGLRAALCEAEDGLADELVAEAYAARALYAALAVEHYLARDFDLLGLDVFVFDVARLPVTVGVRVLLKFAFARFVANGAVERVVQQNELQNALAAALDGVAVCDNVHVLRDFRAAGDCRLGHKGDFRRTVRLFEQLARGSVARGHTDCDKAHSARTRDFQVGVVAEKRNFDAEAAARVEHVQPRVDLIVRAVDVDFYLAGFHTK